MFSIRMSYLSVAAVAAVLPSASHANMNIVIDHTREYQEFYGCGGSWTDSAAWIVSGNRDNPASDPRELSNQEKDEIFSALFSKSDPGGIGLDILRQPMGSSDFRRSDYTYEDSKGTFTVERDQDYIIPTIQRSIEENPAIKVMALPWSPPTWAKYNNYLNGGGIKNDPSTLGDYYEYFVNFVHAYEGENIPIWALSVQNEPQHSSNDYPTMSMSSYDHGKLIQGVRAALDGAGKQDIKVVGYDHNWDTPSFISNFMNDASVRTAVDAIAFHCYGGDVSTQTSIKDQYPEVEIFFTECTEHGNMDSFNSDFRWALANVVIGATRNWASTVIESNLVLCSNGPKIDGGCSNCRGLIDVFDGGYVKNPAFYALGHLSKFLQVGAKRIESSQPTWNTKTLAMLNPDGSSFVVILNDGVPDQTYDIHWLGATCTVYVRSWSAVTVVRSPGSYIVQVWRTTDQDSNTRLKYTEDVPCVREPSRTPAPVPKPPRPTSAPIRSPNKSSTKYILTNTLVLVLSWVLFDFRS